MAMGVNQRRQYTVVVALPGGHIVHKTARAVVQAQGCQSAPMLKTITQVMII